VLNIAVIILTHNEEHHIGRAIASVRDLCREIFIVDSGSTDKTLLIAKKGGAQVLSNAWINYAAQFQWALDNAPISADWVMRLDADEVVGSDLATNIMKTLPTLPSSVTAVKLDRRHIFMGRWIKHGGRYPLSLLRIWRRGSARIENRWMDEHIVQLYGTSIEIKGEFSDVNLGDLTFFTDKHNKYATREALDVLIHRHNIFNLDNALIHGGAGQDSKKRGLKEKIYNRLPFGFGPVLYFLYRYIIQLGFLDGVEGAIYHGLQGLWYRYLVDCKIVELETAMKGAHTRDEKIAILEQRTRLSLSGYARISGGIRADGQI